MADATADTGRNKSTDQTGPVLTADGKSLKRSLSRSLRLQKIRALLLIAPLLLFVLVTFIAPIADMLFRSVENEIVSNTLPRTTAALEEWESRNGELPSEETFEALYHDMFLAAEAKEHTRLGTRLNYEQTGISSLFRSTGRGVDDIGEDQVKALEDLNEAWEDEGFWYALMTGGEGAASDEDLLDFERARLSALTGDSFSGDIGFVPGAAISALLPRTAEAYSAFALFTNVANEDVVAEEEPWEAVKVALITDLKNGADVAGYAGPGAAELQAAAEMVQDLPAVGFRESFLAEDEDWGALDTWTTIQN